MAIERTQRRFAERRLRAVAAELLEASTLCAIATVTRAGRSYVNTAYFAWAPDFKLVWLSAPGAQHSRNVRADGSVAIAVFDSDQSWGNPDRGIQLFGDASEVRGAAADEAEAVYAARFPAYERPSFSEYRFYRFRTRRLKLFDERALGGGTFVTASVGADAKLRWERTEKYISRPRTGRTRLRRSAE